MKTLFITCCQIFLLTVNFIITVGAYKNVALFIIFHSSGDVVLFSFFFLVFRRSGARNWNMGCGE